MFRTDPGGQSFLHLPVLGFMLYPGLHSLTLLHLPVSIFRIDPGGQSLIHLPVLGFILNPGLQIILLN